MKQSAQWMLYGAYGYTGQLIAREAVSRGMAPVLAGRDVRRTRELAEQLNCPWRVFDLSSSADVAGQFDSISAVLHCAGPFSQTARTMVEACIAAGVHYLDITGEIDVIEMVHQQHSRAADAGIALLPAVGMDVVPSDCLANLLARRLPDAQRLELAFTADQPVSPGTAKTVWSRMGDGGQIRRDGEIVRVPGAWKTRKIPFDSRPRWAMTIAWGDVSSAYHSTGIRNIEVYAALPRRQIRTVRRLRWLTPLIKLPPVQAMGRWYAHHYVKGPSDEVRSRQRTEFWGRVTDGDGNIAEATLETPNGYSLTAITALEFMQQVLEGQIAPGFSTPAMAAGADYILKLEDVTFRWR